MTSRLSCSAGTLPSSCSKCLVVTGVAHPECPDLTLGVDRTHARAHQGPGGVEGLVRALIPVEAHGVQNQVHLSLEGGQPLGWVDGEALGPERREVPVVRLVGGRKAVGPLEQGELDGGQAGWAIAPDGQDVGPPVNGVLSFLARPSASHGPGHRWS